MRIVLIGGPASGKTTLGKLIAQRWQLSFSDTDHWVESQSHKAIVQIFAEEGEPIFRAWETKALQVLLQQENAVISTGGGIVKKPENRALLTDETVVYLDVSIDEQLKRTAGDITRPLLMGSDKRVILEKLHQERDPLYQSVASITVDADLPIEEILQKLSERLAQ